MNKIKVAVLFGGISSEHEISLLSAASVLRNIPKDKYELLPVGITKSGKWFYYKGSFDNLQDSKWEKDAQNENVFFAPGSGFMGLMSEGGEHIPVDVVFPVLHGKGGEDGTVQGLLDMLGMPYVGCGVLGSALCMDKIAANFAMDGAGIARCEWDYMLKSDLADFDAIEKRVSAKLGYPIFVKPANAGSSVGISKAADKTELKAAVELALKHDTRILFERTVIAHEVECAVMGNESPFSTLPGEILASKSFYDYEDKYIAGTSKTVIPADLPKETLLNVQSAAVRAYKALCCKGLARVDFFVEHGTGKILLNEINTLPGFTSISMYPKLMMDYGMSYGEILDRLIMLATGKSEADNG
ncbi:MAG: D-alanine--D-alanine ligase family protein [Oscillospiraceae bacterium]